MRTAGAIVLGLLSLLDISPRAAATMLGPIGTPASTMRIFGPVDPPFGFNGLCVRQPTECAPGPPHESQARARPERLAELDEVNRQVNQDVSPVADLELYGTTEYWALPTDKGDCEDYAVLKRKRLIDKGWPVGTVLITVVRQPNGEGHAVLTARTTQGDLILDNLAPDVRLWHRTPYRYLMRQSYLDPRAWVSLDPGHESAPAAIAGARR